MIKLSKKEWLQHFLDWAKSQADIQAVALIGSAARLDHPADEWSDYDLIVVASNPQIYLASTEWLDNLGRTWCSLREKTSTGEAIEWRVLFEGGIDIDFIIVSVDNAHLGFQNMPMVLEISQRGRKVLWDRDNVLSEISASSIITQTAYPPSSQQFLDIVNDFWFHVAWTAKKLRRGELWIAKKCCDTYLKDLLLRMMEWEAQSVNGGKVDTWFDGRFLEQWALPKTVAELCQVFAYYDTEDVWRALEATMKIFQQIAQETATLLGYTYPLESAKCVSDWVSRVRTNDGSSG